MNRLTKFDKFSALTGEFMQRGVRTNFFKSREQIERAISDGSVYYELCETSLLLIFSGKVDKLYFMLLSGGRFPELHLERSTVCEYAYKTGSAPDVADELVKLGLLHSANRERYEFAGTFPSEFPAGVRFAVQNDLGFAEEVLSVCFDPLTGCLPTRDELSSDIAARHLLVADGGVLRFSTDGTVGELNHLAVLPKARRSGVGSALVTAFLAAASARRFRLWVRTDNPAAQALYRRFGFAPGRFRSEVFTFTPKDQSV